MAHVVIKQSAPGISRMQILPAKLTRPNQKNVITVSKICYVWNIRVYKISQQEFELFPFEFKEKMKEKKQFI